MKSCGIVLSGGRGQRVGGADKGRLPWESSTRVESVIARLAPQVDSIIISANRNLDWYQSLGHKVVSDKLPDFAGPLAGLSACLPYCEADICVTAPCDSPQLPENLFSRMSAALEPGLDACCAHDGERAQYLFLAVRPAVNESLVDYLSTDGRSVKGWLKRIRVRNVDFSDQRDAFLNLNE